MLIDTAGQVDKYMILWLCGSEKEPYSIYEILKPIEVDAGKTAPWFGEPGGGIQYKLPYTIEELIRMEYIE